MTRLVVSNYFYMTLMNAALQAFTKLQKHFRCLSKCIEVFAKLWPKPIFQDQIW